MNALYQIEIPKRARACCTCLHTFSDGKVYISVLSHADSDQWTRCDFCEKCYKQVHPKKKPPIMWKGNAVCNISVKPDETDQKLQLIGLLREMLSNGADVDETFVIALYLARKRALLFRHEIQAPGGRMMWVYEAAGTEEMFSVPKAPLDRLQDLQQLQEKASYRRFLAILSETNHHV